MKEFEEHTNKTLEYGVEMNNIPAIEIYFQTSINVFSLQDNKTAIALRLLKLDYQPVLSINLYEDHFSYIKDFMKYAKKYTCNICQRILNKSCNFQRHAKDCSVEIEEQYIGGKYRKKRIFSSSWMRRR